MDLIYNAERTYDEFDGLFRASSFEAIAGCNKIVAFTLNT